MHLTYNNLKLLSHLDQCTCRFPDTVSPNVSERGDVNKFTTRLFPDMRFGCNGTIVRMVVAVVDRGGREVPKIQIWRESKTQAGIYHRQDSDIRVVNDSSMCIRHCLGGGIF